MRNRDYDRDERCFRKISNAYQVRFHQIVTVISEN